MMNPAPIILFVYNRLEHTQKTLEALQKNDLANESALFIYSDGFKNEDTPLKVEEVRHFIRGIKGFKSVTIVARDHNWGLADNIIDGVTQIVNIYGKVIVLEDDVVTSPFFLRYMNNALEFFDGESKVMHISGYMFPINTNELREAFFLRPTSCWGWATWSRAWKYFKKDQEGLVKMFDRKMVKEFNLNNAYNYWSQVELNLEGKINTWAVFWYASVFLNRGLSLHPKCSFVRNIGHDSSGVHSETTNNFDTGSLNTYSIDFGKIPIILDNTAAGRLEHYFRSIRKNIFQKICRRARLLSEKVFK